MLFPMIQRLGDEESAEERLHAFPLNDLRHCRSFVYLAYNRQKYVPAFQRYFADLAREAFQKNRAEGIFCFDLE
jgi:hypothetical protein